MFRLTADIKAGSFKTFKPSSLKWTRSVDNVIDQASFTIPAMCRLVDKEKAYANVQTGMQLKEGDRVKMYAGYDGNNKLQFDGYISRINFTVPLTVDCENAGYLLKRKMVNKTFDRTTVKEVLEFITKGTAITISPKTPANIVFEPVTFSNYTALQVLEWLKEKYMLTVCFFGHELYAGWRATYQGNRVKLRLNWNVAKDDQLLFRTYDGTAVHIEMQSRKPDGSREKRRALNNPRPGDVKVVKTYMQNAEDMQQAANDLQLVQLQQGYTGGLTCFLVPHIEPGDTIEIIDSRYAERNGLYFCGSVAGSFDRNGGRQMPNIDFKLS